MQQRCDLISRRLTTGGKTGYGEPLKQLAAKANACKYIVTVA